MAVAWQPEQNCRVCLEIEAWLNNQNHVAGLVHLPSTWAERTAVALPALVHPFLKEKPTLVFFP